MFESGSISLKLIYSGWCIGPTFTCIEIHFKLNRKNTSRLFGKNNLYENGKLLPSKYENVVYMTDYIDKNTTFWGDYLAISCPS